eukprot:TRINITY_DN13881_c0_g1_i1.p1 TRINITY_DN13881_c0_g1~~TRINITY_DN13881_c0_g1_i1.p1  ORF type:complete len:179 (+),score=1.33 TRINITY_DN13881_c0_g1_i1:199-735(+)
MSEFINPPLSPSIPLISYSTLLRLMTSSSTSRLYTIHQQSSYSPTTFTPSTHTHHQTQYQSISKDMQSPLHHTEKLFSTRPIHIHPIPHLFLPYPITITLRQFHSISLSSSSLSLTLPNTCSHLSPLPSLLHIQRHISRWSVPLSSLSSSTTQSLSLFQAIYTIMHISESPILFLIRL